MSGALSFRPLVWTESLALRSTDSLERHGNSTCIDDSVPHFSWSTGVSLNDLWTRVKVIENETLNIEAINTVEPIFSSGLPKYLPVQTLRCVPTARTYLDDLQPQDSQKLRSSTSLNSYHSPFYMSLVTEWTSCVQRNRSCQQMTISVNPPFRIRSTVPMPIRWGLT